MKKISIMFLMTAFAFQGSCAQKLSATDLQMLQDLDPSLMQTFDPSIMQAFSASDTDAKSLSSSEALAPRDLSEQNGPEETFDRAPGPNISQEDPRTAPGMGNKSRTHSQRVHRKIIVDPISTMVNPAERKAFYQRHEELRAERMRKHALGRAKIARDMAQEKENLRLMQENIAKLTKENEERDLVLASLQMEQQKQQDARAQKAKANEDRKAQEAMKLAEKRAKEEAEMLQKAQSKGMIRRAWDKVTNNKKKSLAIALAIAAAGYTVPYVLANPGVLSGAISSAISTIKSFGFTSWFSSAFNTVKNSWLVSKMTGAASAVAESPLVSWTSSIFSYASKPAAYVMEKMGLSASENEDEMLKQFQEWEKLSPEQQKEELARMSASGALSV